MVYSIMKCILILATLTAFTGWVFTGNNRYLVVAVIYSVTSALFTWANDDKSKTINIPSADVEQKQGEYYRCLERKKEKDND